MASLDTRPFEDAAAERDITFEKARETLPACASLAAELGLDAEGLMDLAESVINQDMMKGGSVENAVINNDMLNRIRTAHAREMQSRTKAGHVVASTPVPLTATTSFSATPTSLEAVFAISGVSKRKPPPTRATPPAKAPRRGFGGSPGAARGLTSPAPAAGAGFSPQSAAVAPASTPRSTPRSAPRAARPSPDSTPYYSRTNATAVVASFPAGGWEESDELYEGVANSNPALADATFACGVSAAKVLDVRPVTAEQAVWGPGNVTAPYKFMFTPLHLRARKLDERVNRISQVLLESAGFPEIEPVNVTAQEPISTAGRICCDEDGRLNRHSILLEGSAATSHGARVALSMTEATDYCLFPGAVVGVRGMNNMGNRLVAEEVCHGVPLPPATSPVEVLRAQARTARGPLRVWSVRGPYTLDADLKFQPLLDFLGEVSEATTPPDVIIMMGPFLSANHPLLTVGPARVSNADGTEFSLSFEEAWEVRIMLNLETVLDQPRLNHTRVVLVPSSEDLVAVPSFPQPPLRESLISSKLRDRITLVSNPGTFSVGGVVFGAVSEEVLTHIMQDSARPEERMADPLHRVAKALLEQRSYFPLFPAPKDVPVELSQYEHLDMPVSPDVLLVPCGSPPFAKPEGETLIVNHGLLARKNFGGTFAKMEIFPPREDDLPEGDEAAMAPHRVPKRSHVKIVRV